MNTVAIIQARMSSTRLPGKVLEPLGPAPVVAWVAVRAAAAELVNQVVIATSTHPSDDAVEGAAHELGLTCERGSLDDVLERYRAAAVSSRADCVVRLTADCPFLDPATIDLAVRTWHEQAADYVSTNLAGGYPHGLDVEVLSAAVLNDAATEARDPAEREHVTLFVYRRPERFRCVAVPPQAWAQHADLRLTVDEPADLQLARAVVHRLGGAPETLSSRDVIELLAADPSLRNINARVQHRHVAPFPSAQTPPPTLS